MSALPAPPRSAAPAPQARLGLEAIARDALLARLEGQEADRCCETALAALAQACGRTAALVVLDDDGRPLARHGAAFDEAVAGSLAMRLEHRGRLVGRLLLAAPADPATAAGDAELRAALPELTPTLAHLASGHARLSAPTTALETMRAALAAGGTFVWDWDLDSDRTGEVDDSLLYLGYGADGPGDSLAEWEALVHPDDLHRIHESCENHLSGKASFYEAEYRVRAADGRWYWFLERGRIIDRHPDGRARRMVGVLTDTTDRHAIADQAALANERLAKVARHVPGVLYQIELRDGLRPRFRYVNERLADLIGTDPARSPDDIGQLFRAIVPGDRQPLVDSLFESARVLGEWRHEFRIRGADGSLRWIQGMSTPQREADGCLVWHGYLHDVTVRRELEAARRDIASAEAGSRAKNDFLSRMSHELRTPLNAVLGVAQLLELDRAPALADPHRQRVRLIREAGEHLLEMIRDLLDLTRIESGTLPLELARVPLRALAEESVRMVQAQALKAGVQLQVNGDDSTLAAWADRTRLRQVLLNLLSNAIKYNRPEGWVEVGLHAGAPGWVQLIVEDNGVGIAPDSLARLFEPFHRGAHAGSKIEGNGIGLSVTRGLVEAMAGQIVVLSTPGLGTTFTVTLPADSDTDSDAAPGAPAERAAERA